MFFYRVCVGFAEVNWQTRSKVHGAVHDNRIVLSFENGFNASRECVVICFADKFLIQSCTSVTQSWGGEHPVYGVEW